MIQDLVSYTAGTTVSSGAKHLVQLAPYQWFMLEWNAVPKILVKIVKNWEILLPPKNPLVRCHSHHTNPDLDATPLKLLLFNLLYPMSIVVLINCTIKGDFVLLLSITCDDQAGVCLFGEKIILYLLT